MSTEKIVSRRGLFGRKDPKLPETVQSIPVPGLGTVRFVHSAHILRNTRSELGNADAIGLETGDLNLYERLMHQEESKENLRTLIGAHQYRTIMKQAARRHTPMPIFFVDVRITWKDFKIDRLVGRQQNPGHINRRRLLTGLGLIAATAATTVGYKKGLDAVTHDDSKERDGSVVTEMIKWTLSFVAGSATTTGAFAGGGRKPSSAIHKFLIAAMREDKERGYADFSQRVRDLVFADKFVAALEVCKQRGIVEPSIAGFLGSSHYEGVKEALALDPIERRTFIRDLAAHIGERQFDNYDGAGVMRRILRDSSVLPMILLDEKGNISKHRLYTMPIRDSFNAGPKKTGAGN